jgi:hypothetical protein
MGEWRYSSTSLNLDTRWSWVVTFTPRPLYPRGNCPRYPLDRRLGGPQSLSGHYRRENISCPCRELNFDSSAVQRVACSLYSNLLSCIIYFFTVVCILLHVNSLLTVFGFTVYATICQFFRYITCFDPKGSSSGVSEHMEFNFHCVSFTFFTCFKLLILKISVFKYIKHFVWNKRVEFVKLLLKLLCF